MIPPVELWDDHTRIPYSRRTDPEAPHSSTRCRTSATNGHPGWLIIRDAETRVTAMLKASRQHLHLVGHEPPDTVVAALPGRAVRELVDHPLFAPGTVGGDVRIRRARVVPARAARTRDFHYDLPRLVVECAGPLINLRDLPVRVIMYRNGYPLLDVGDEDASPWHRMVVARYSRC